MWRELWWFTLLGISNTLLPLLRNLGKLPALGLCWNYIWLWVAAAGFLGTDLLLFLPWILQWWLEQRRDGPGQLQRCHSYLPCGDPTVMPGDLQTFGIKWIFKLSVLVISSQKVNPKPPPKLWLWNCNLQTVNFFPHQCLWFIYNSGYLDSAPICACFTEDWGMSRAQTLFCCYYFFGFFFRTWPQLYSPDWLGTYCYVRLALNSQSFVFFGLQTAGIKGLCVTLQPVWTQNFSKSPWEFRFIEFSFFKLEFDNFSFWKWLSVILFYLSW